MFQPPPPPWRPMCMYSLQSNWSLEKGVVLHWTLSPILQCPEDCQRSPFPRSKPSYFSSMGGVFLILKILSFSHSHSLCAYTMHAAVSSMPTCHTDTISLCMPLLSSTQDRVGKSPDFGGTGERWVVFFFACDTLFPFTSNGSSNAVSWGHVAALAWSCPGYLVWAHVQL